MSDTSPQLAREPYQPPRIERRSPIEAPLVGVGSSLIMM
jgi:hypothetical protein